MDKLRCWKPGKRSLSVLLSVAMLLGMVALGGVIQAGATIYVEKQDNPPPIAFSAPETIYVNPVTNRVEYFAGQLPTTASGDTFGVNADGTVDNATARNPSAASSVIHFWCGDLDTAYPVTIEQAAGPGFGFTTQTIATGGVNRNYTLLNGGTVSAPYPGGLITWKVTYYSGGAQYTAYTYSYLFVPDKRAISGVVGLTASGKSGTGWFQMYFDSAFMISGSHYRYVKRTDGTEIIQPNNGGYGLQGNDYECTPTHATMQGNVWSGTTFTANILMDSQYANAYSVGDPTSPNPMSIRLRDLARGGGWNPFSSRNNTNNTTSGRGYIQVDRSRYNDLSQIPQLRLNYVVGYHSFDGSMTNNAFFDPADRRINNAFINNPTGGANETIGGALPFRSWQNRNFTNMGTNGTMYREQVKGSITGTALDANGSYNYYSQYDWDLDDGALVATTGSTNNRFTTSLTYTVRDKRYLRAKLCEEIGSGIQIDTLGNKATYKAAIERLALALCKPDYIFEYSNGNSSVTLDCGPDDVPGSMAKEVKDQHELSLVFQGEAYIAKNVYYSSVATPPKQVAEGDVINYYLGNSVYSKYNPAVSATGYRPNPVGVNPPGTIPPSGSFLGGTSEAYEPWVGGVTITGAAMSNRTAVNLGVSGLAQDAPDAINLNTKLTTGLQWNWFLDPIENKVVYYSGAEDALGTMADDFVQWDTEGTLKPCAFVRPGWTFDYWEFNGNPYWYPGDTFSNLIPADNRPDGVTSSDTVGVLSCKAVWKQADPEPRILWIDPLGGSVDYMDPAIVKQDVPGTDFITGSGLYYIKSNNHVVYGNLTQYLPLLSKSGYKHAGDWYFSSTCDTTTAWDRFTFRYLEDAPAGPGLVVYPNWVALSSTIRYLKNYTGNDGQGQNPASQVAYTDQPITLRDLASAYDGPLERFGYDFLGWYPNIEVPAVYRPLTGLDTSKLYGEGATYSYADLFGSVTNTDDEITLCAVWQAKTYPLKFNVNWHDIDTTSIAPESPPGGMWDYVMATQNKVYGYTYGQSGAASGVITEWVPDPVRFGWTFAGWYTDPDPALGTRVTPDMTFTRIDLPGSVFNEATSIRKELFAHWISGNDVPIDPIMLSPGKEVGKEGTFIGLARGISMNFGPRGQGMELDLTGLEAGIIPPAGYKFVRWEMVPGTVTENELIDVYAGGVTQKLIVVDNGGSTSLLKKDILQAVWEEEEFTVVYALNEPLGSTVTPALPFTLDHVTLSSYGTYLPLPAPPYSCDGFTLEGYTFDPNGTGTIFQDHKPAPAVANPPTVAQVFANAYREETVNGPVYTLYAVWKKIGGLPPPGEFDPDDGDIPDKPQWPPLVDPDGKDGYIVMYFTAPKDVVVTPAYQLQESRRFLEYDKPYGKMPTAAKTDGIFVGWRVIKYGSNGSREVPAGLLGKMINSADKVNHIYSIWVAPVFEPGYVVTYDANGGTIVNEGAATQTRRVVFPTMYGVSGQTYGEFDMPTAQRQDYKFLGWYTKPEGGQLVTASTVIDPSGRVGGVLYAPGELTKVNDLPVTDILFAHWEKTTSTAQDIWNGVTGWLSSDSLAHLPNWANLTLLGIGLPLLGITSGTFASLTTATIFLASFLGLLFFPLAFMLPFLFPVIAALMPVWWPLLLI